MTLRLTPLQAKIRLNTDGPFEMDGFQIEAESDGSPCALGDDGDVILSINGQLGDEVTYDTRWIGEDELNA